MFDRLVSQPALVHWHFGSVNVGCLFSAVTRWATHHQPFNPALTFKGGTVVTVKFKQPPAAEAIARLNKTSEMR
jgi:hypothetical protein